MFHQVFVPDRHDVGAKPCDDIQVIHVGQRRHLRADTENHERQKVVDADPAFLQIIEIGLELVGNIEACSGQNPVVGVAVQQDFSDMRQFDGRSVRKEQMSEAHIVSGGVEGV